MRSESAVVGREPEPSGLPPVARWRLAVRLLSGCERGWRRASRFLVRGLADRRRTTEWLGQLASPELARVWLADPSLASRLQEPYLDLAWTVGERMDALAGHHASLASLFGPLGMESLYSGMVPLVRLVRPGGQGMVELALGHCPILGRWGELTLAVRDSRSGRHLAALTFSFQYSFGRRIIFIGGLHADCDPAVRQLGRDLRTEVHGLRPKALALWALQELGTVWQVEGLHAVAGARAIPADAPGSGPVAAAGDPFWLESDGRRMADGTWDLPCQFRPRAREELKPSRRRTHERRYALLASLGPKLREAVGALPSGGYGSEGAGARPGEFALETGLESFAGSAWPMPTPPSPSTHGPDLAMPGEISPVPAT